MGKLLSSKEALGAKRCPPASNKCRVNWLTCPSNILAVKRLFAAFSNAQSTKQCFQVFRFFKIRCSAASWDGIFLGEKF